MPWIADHKGDPVTPEDISTRDQLVCPDCSEEMYVYGLYMRSDGSFIARYFSHNPTGSGALDAAGATQCGGETDEHEWMKSIAYSKIKHLFDDAIDTVEIEMTVGGSRKFVDVGVIFNDHIDEHDVIADGDCISGAVGDRLAIEVQYRNDSKGIQGTAQTYAANGYTTLWLYPEQFSNCE